MAKTVIFPDKTDVEIAHMVRMLMRDDIRHEAVITAARDRILKLVDENERLRNLLASKGVSDDELADCVGEGC
jgi:hypothetical protein